MHNTLAQAPHTLLVRCTIAILSIAGPSLLETYKYYAVINNGMRGPFAEAGLGFEQQHWLQPFIDKIDNHVSILSKLHGAPVTCKVARCFVCGA